MSVFFKSVSTSFRSFNTSLSLNWNAVSQINSRVFPIKRTQIPYLNAPHHFHSFAGKIFEMFHRFKELSYEKTTFGNISRTCLETLTGMKQLNVEETAQAVIDHQKLGVAHASIANYAQASKHYEMVYSMQLFEKSKDFSTQLYYLNLLEKKAPDELRKKELQEIVDLYAFALTCNQDSLAFLDLKEKLQKYQALLGEPEKKL